MKLWRAWKIAAPAADWLVALKKIGKRSFELASIRLPGQRLGLGVTLTMFIAVVYR
jgi:hypothetical protein